MRHSGARHHSSRCQSRRVRSAAPTPASSGGRVLPAASPCRRPTLRCMSARRGCSRLRAALYRRWTLAWVPPSARGATVSAMSGAARRCDAF